MKIGIDISADKHFTRLTYCAMESSGFIKSIGHFDISNLDLNQDGMTQKITTALANIFNISIDQVIIEKP